MENSLMTKFEHLLKCSMCSNMFSKERIPMQLRCCHNMCKYCLDKNIQASKSANFSIFSCPACEEKVDCDDEFKTNIFIHNVAIAIGQVEEATATTICRLCKKANSTFFCWDCIKGFCDVCNDAFHELLENHNKIGKIDEVTDAKILECISGKKQYCSILNHTMKTIDYFCMTCNELACTDCIVVKHQCTDKRIIKEAAEEKRSVIEDSSNLLREKCDEIKEKIEKLATRKTDWEKLAKHRQADILKQADDAISAINKKKYQLIIKLQLKTHSITVHIAGLIKELKQDLNSFSQRIEENRLALELNNPTFLLQMLENPSHDSDRQQDFCMKTDHFGTGSSLIMDDTRNSRKIAPTDIFGSCVIHEMINELNVDVKPGGLNIINDSYIFGRSWGNVGGVYNFHGQKVHSFNLGEHEHLSDVIVYNDQIFVTCNMNKIYCFDKDCKFLKYLELSDNLNAQSVSIRGDKLFFSNINISCEIYTGLTTDLEGEYINLKRFEQKIEPPVMFKLPSFLATNDQLLVVSDIQAHQVHAFKFDGQHVFTYGTGQSGDDDGQLCHPWGVCCHDDRIIIADCRNNRLVMLSDNGKLQGYIKHQGMCAPRSVAVGEDGLLRVAHGLDNGPWFVSTLRYKVV